MRLVGSWHLPRRSSANSRQGTQQLSSNGAPSSVMPADDGIPVGRLGLYVLTGHVFGKGANGRVYQGRHSITGQEVALKQLTDGVAASRAGGGRRSGADVVPPREVLAMRHLPPHPNIAQLVEHVCVNGQHYIVMEPCYGGELFAQVEASGSLPEEYVLRLTRGAASAVSHMHSHGVAHRDLKLENMLVSEQGGECVKICDFGLAHVHALGPPPRRGDDLLGVCQSAELLVRVCGTKSYAAPEVLASVPYDGFRADIWSLGVCIFGMVAGFFPLEVARRADWRFNSLYEAQKAGASSVATIYGFYSRDCPFSPSLIELLDQMLQIAPSRRPSIFQVMASRWMHDPAAGHATPVAAAAAAAAANATEHIAAVTMDNANADDIIRCSLNARTRSGKHKQMELRHPSSTMRAHTYPRTSAHPCLREHVLHVGVNRRAEARDDLDARQQIEPAVEGEPRANEVGVVVNGVDVNVGVGGSERFEDANGVGDVEYCREDGVALDTTCLAGCQALIQCQALALHIYGGRAE
mmetsp:Transcript_25120/g.81243  ORF Transcript_25120/g.81243 Transcript_25120/m.81243 type:complete len:524 (-) Transcript_25120:146-1717(-)